MNVTKKDNKSLYYWIGSVRGSYRNIQKGKHHRITLTSNRIDITMVIVILMRFPLISIVEPRFSAPTAQQHQINVEACEVEEAIDKFR